MRLYSFLLMLPLLLMACGDGPIYPVEPELYEWVKDPDAIDPTSDQTPSVADPVVTFRLDPGDRRSALRTGEDWRLGQTYLFGFDVRVASGTLGSDTIALSRLFRTGGGTSEIASVQLDADRGITVMGRDCIAPPDLRERHRVEMRIRLSNKDAGFLEVFCDRKPIWARTKIRTTFPPVCRLSEGCVADVPKPTRYEWQMGLLSERSVSTPVTVQMQRLHYRILLYIPNRPGTL